MANDDGDGDGGQESSGRLRSPLLTDGQPNFHWWLFLPGVGVALLWALYGAVTAEADAMGRFLAQLLWPGAPIFVAATAAAWLGWRLDID